MAGAAARSRLAMPAFAIHRWPSLRQGPFSPWIAESVSRLSNDVRFRPVADVHDLRSWISTMVSNKVPSGYLSNMLDKRCSTGGAFAMLMVTVKRQSGIP